jgi:CheY-like chemotaxis protein
LREGRVPEPSNSRKTILAVDDVAEVLELIAAVLGDFGYEVDCAGNGDQALECLRNGKHYDLLFTDIMMPGGLHGFELARRARAIRPALKVIYLTGYASMIPDDTGETFGPILRKPFRPSELGVAVERELVASPG